MITIRKVLITILQAGTATFRKLKFSGTYGFSELAKFVPWSASLVTLEFTYEFTPEWQVVIDEMFQSQRQSLRFLTIMKDYKFNDSKRHMLSISQLLRLERLEYTSLYLDYTPEEICDLVFAAPSLTTFVWNFIGFVYDEHDNAIEGDASWVFDGKKILWLRRTLTLAHERGYKISYVEIVVRNDDDETKHHLWEHIKKTTQDMCKKSITVNFMTDI